MPYNQQFYPNYNPYGMPQMPQAPQTPQIPHGQTIQTIDKPMDSQSFCYFVKSIEDMKNVKVIPGAYYIGINEDADEMYVRKVKEDDGTTVSKKYVLASDSHEKTPIELILERLDVIEEKLNNHSSSGWRSKGDK